MPMIEDAITARERLLDMVQLIRATASAGVSAGVHLEEPSELRARRFALPPADALQGAFKYLESSEQQEAGHGILPGISPVRRGALYGVIRGGFASERLRPRLLAVRNGDDHPIGEIVFDWMHGQLHQYKIALEALETLTPRLAVEEATMAIRMHLSKELGLTSCDPENLELRACRGPFPDDTDFLTTVVASGDYPRTIAQLARVYDPRQWDQNPYANRFFTDVHPVTDSGGYTEEARREPIGASWSGWISERVEGAGGYLVNTLRMDYVVEQTSILFRYELGKTVSSSSTLKLERDFGHLTVTPVPGRQDWSRVAVEKNINFSPIPGATHGIFVGWGDLANLVAPAVAAKWFHGLHGMPCWPGR